MRYTERSLKILKYAEMEAERTTMIVYPVHLSLTFHDGITIKEKWISNGDMVQFLDTFKFFSLYRLIDKARKRFD